MLHQIEQYPDGPRVLARLGPHPTIHPTCTIRSCWIGEWTEIGPHTVMVETTFEDYSYVAGAGQLIYATVGKFCSLASNVRINPGNHPVERVTQHHLTYRRMQYGFDMRDDDAFFDWRRRQLCAIGHDVWIGHNATVMPGVQIGTGAVVGAGAVVTRNVDPYTIVVGVPARPLRMRFPPAVVERLLAIAWWDWDRATLEARFHDLVDINAFLEKYA